MAAQHQPETEEVAATGPADGHRDGIQIDVPNDVCPYLPGARLLSILAHPPTIGRMRAWQTTERAFCRIYLEAQQMEDPDWSSRPQWIIPNHYDMSLSEASKRVALATDRLTHRLAAAHVVIPLLKAIDRDSGASRRAEQMSVDGRILRTLEQEENRREWLQERGETVKARLPGLVDNFDNRVVRPSLPVIHIAVAAAVAIDMSQKSLRALGKPKRDLYGYDFGGHQMSLGHVLTSPKIAMWIIRESQVYEDLVTRLPKLTPKSGSLVRLRLAAA